MPKLGFHIIDPHIHQWDPYVTPRATSSLVKLFGNYPKLMDKLIRIVKPKSLAETVGLTDYVLSSYLPKNYREDLGKHSVESVVHVEADWHDNSPLGVVNETTWVSQLPFKAPGPVLSGIIGAADPCAPNFAEVLAAHQQASPLFRGIRKMASYHADKGVFRWCNQPNLYTTSAFLSGFEVLAKTSLTFEAWVYSTQLKDVIELAKHFPDTPIMMDHLATPVGLFGPVGKHTGRTEAERAGIFLQWQELIAELAEQKNVHVKISGIMMPVLGHEFYKQRLLASMDELVERLAPLVNHALAVFGRDRLLYASNFPMDKVNARLEDLIDAYIQVLQPHGEQTLRAIFRDNAKAFYQL